MEPGVLQASWTVQLLKSARPITLRTRRGVTESSRSERQKAAAPPPGCISAARRFEPPAATRHPYLDRSSRQSIGSFQPLKSWSLQRTFFAHDPFWWAKSGKSFDGFAGLLLADFPIDLATVTTSGCNRVQAVSRHPQAIIRRVSFS